jgi:protoporphyrinogen oxidase
MPITQLIKGFSDVPPEILELTETLRYRNTILVYLRVDRDNLFSDNWLYIHSSDLLMGRMTNFKNWVPTICKGQSDTILALEYWCFDNNELWAMDDEKLISMAGAEVKKTGLLNGAKILDGYICRISKSYPVYYKGYREQLKKIEDYLDTIDNVTVIGRSGSFKYNNQDHSILMGILAAENISDGAKHDLWNINTDDEYQESSVITKSGLQKK